MPQVQKQQAEASRFSYLRESGLLRVQKQEVSRFSYPEEFGLLHVQKQEAALQQTNIRARRKAAVV